jgi:preprotein translocase subunit YajC
MNKANTFEIIIVIILGVAFILWLVRRNKKDEEEDL